MNLSTKHPRPNTEPFDETAKEFYRQFFENCGLPVKTQYEVFFRGRAIDLVVNCPAVEQRQRLQTTVFSYFRRFNALEFKGLNDPLTFRDYNKIMMRVWGLGALQSGNKSKKTRKPIKTLEADNPEDYLTRLPSQRTLTIVCVTKPDKILSLPAEFQFRPTAEAGIYHNPGQIAQWLICPSELEIKPANYPLLPLARGPKLADFMALCLQKGLLDYILLTLRVGMSSDPFTIWQQILEVQRMDVYEPGQHEAVIPYIERYFQAYPEDLKRLSLTHALLAEQLQQGLQQGIQQGQRQGIQQLLLRHWQQKFNRLPEIVKQRVETTENVELLDTWLTQVIMANSLADTDLGRSLV